jgi:hypothetical protein
MRTLPKTLPDHLPDYAPGRIALVSPEAWPLPDMDARMGIPSSIPRYALEVRTKLATIDPERVRWLVERSATRPLSTRHVHLAHHRGLLHVVDGHHALAAHLVTGSDRVPVRLVSA